MLEASFLRFFFNFLRSYIIVLIRVTQIAMYPTVCVPDTKTRKIPFTDCTIVSYLHQSKVKATLKIR